MKSLQVPRWLVVPPSVLRRALHSVSVLHLIFMDHTFVPPRNPPQEGRDPTFLETVESSTLSLQAFKGYRTAAMAEDHVSVHASEKSNTSLKGDNSSKDDNSVRIDDEEETLELIDGGTRAWLQVAGSFLVFGK